MKRFTLQEFERWKNKPSRRPLLVRGARQVGKTWLVRQHGQSYHNFLELNLEANPEYHKTFQELYGKPKKLVQALSLLAEQPIISGKTLLFLDEIQECPEALLSLRYFKEELPELHVIAAGSLLEFTFENLSFPVGRIEFLHLFPMNFAEFLLALKKEEWLEFLAAKSCWTPIPQSLHEALLETLRSYCLVGGMPEVVKNFATSGKLQERLGACQETQQILAADFREDFHKYASKSNVEYLRIVFQAAPRLFGQKFKYSQVDSHYKSRELGLALQHLEMAGLLYRVFHSSGSGLPLGAQKNPKKFKVFSLDLGLSNRLLGLSLSELYLKRRELLSHRGGLAEQLVAQELLSLTPQNQTPELYYWHREALSSKAEVDFVIPFGEQVVPVEVKSGRSSRIKSMKIFLEEKKVWTDFGLKLSEENFSKAENIYTLPLYALYHWEDYLKGNSNDSFQERLKNANAKKALKILDRIGADEPPREGDEL